MKQVRRQEPHLKVLTSRWVTFPLLLIIGFGSGFISAGYDWSKRGYQFLPSKIVVKPPPTNATWCFPDRGFAGAVNFEQELKSRMNKSHLSLYSDSVLNNSIKASLIKGDGAFSLHLLHVSPKRFGVISAATTGFTPYSNYTLVTETGCYYLYPIPKKRSSDYDSLIQKRWEQQAKL